MVFKLIRIDTTDPLKIPLNPGNHRLGRLNGLLELTECEDRRVSRYHARLNVTDDSVVLKAIHSNPCFYTKKHLVDTQILSINNEIELVHGDKFGLLPNMYWYELIHCTETEPEVTEHVTNEHSNVTAKTNEASNVTDKTNDTSNVADETNVTSETNAVPNITNNVSMSQTNSNDSVENVTIEAEVTDITDEVAQEFQNALGENVSEDRLTSPNLLTPGQSSQLNTQEYQPDTSAPNPPVNPDEAVRTPAKRASDNNGDDEEQDVKRVKIEPEVKNEDDQGSPSGVNADPQAPQQGPSNNQIPLPNANPTHRERCMYGAQCYRPKPRCKRSVSYIQILGLWECLNDKRVLVADYNKTRHASEQSRIIWMQVAEKLNADDNGPRKDWKGWSEYWAEYKRRLKSKVAEIKATQKRIAEGGSQVEVRSLSDIEMKFLTILGRDYESFAAPPQNPLTGSTQAQPVISHTTSDHEHPTRILPRSPLAQPITPRAQPRSPRAQPISPRAQPRSPRAQPILPRAQPISPRAQPRSPCTQPISPRAQPISPRAQPRSPRAQPISPRAQTISPRAPPNSPLAQPNPRGPPLPPSLARYQLCKKHRQMEEEREEKELLEKIAVQLRLMQQRLMRISEDISIGSPNLHLL